jgi:hypothetical protein
LHRATGQPATPSAQGGRYRTVTDQVEVTGIDGGIAPKKKDGRPPIGKTAMSNAERQKRWHNRHRNAPETP